MFCGTGLRASRPLPSHILRFALPSGIAASTSITKAVAALIRIRSALDFTQGNWDPPASPNTRRAIEIGVVALLTLAGLMLRVWNIGAVPAAPAGDESAIALEVIRILKGEWFGIWSGAALGNPSGHMVWIAPFFWLGGSTLTMLRLASALPGAFLIPVFYLMVRMVLPFPVALVSAGLVAFFSWFVIVFRIGIPITLAIFLAALSMCLLVYAARSSRLWVAAVGGLILGAGLYVFKGYAIYFGGIWGATILALLVSSRFRRSWVPYLFLGASLLAGAIIIRFYLTTNYLNSNLESQYGVSPADLFAITSHLRRMVEVLLFVHIPPEIRGFGFDGIIPSPLLPPILSVFFWIGLLTTLMFANRRPFQLALLGWLIGMAPAILVPGGETRRYLLGVFFVFVITAIGFAAAVHLIAQRWPARLRPSLASLAGPFDNWRRYCLVAIAGATLLAFFAAHNLAAFGEWSGGQETRFQFDPEISAAAEFLGAVDEGYGVRFYSVRWSVDYETVRWFAPSVRGADGSAEFGGDGTIFSAGVVAEPTVFMLLGGYLDLIGPLQDTYPDGRTTRETDEDGHTLFLAYTIDDPPPPGTVKIPPYYRLFPNPAEMRVGVGETAYFHLDANQADNIRLTLTSPNVETANFSLQGSGCANSVTQATEISPGESVAIEACRAGQGTISLQKADTGELVNSYTIEAFTDGPRVLSPAQPGIARIEPDPETLQIPADPFQHQPLHLITDRSALIIPRPADSLVIHNNPDLAGRDGCEEVEKRPEGDTRLTLIWPDTGVERRSLFYVVGCGRGPAVLDIVIDGEIARSYRLQIGDR